MLTAQDQDLGCLQIWARVFQVLMGQADDGYVLAPGAWYQSADQQAWFNHVNKVTAKEESTRTWNVGRRVVMGGIPTLSFHTRTCGCVGGTSIGCMTSGDITLTLTLGQ